MVDASQGRGSAAAAAQPDWVANAAPVVATRKAGMISSFFIAILLDYGLRRHAAAYPCLRSLQRRAAQASLRKCRCSGKSASYLFGRFHARKNTSDAEYGLILLSKRLIFGLNSSALDNKKMLSGGLSLAFAVIGSREPDPQIRLFRRVSFRLSWRLAQRAEERSSSGR